MFLFFYKKAVYRETFWTLHVPSSTTTNESSRLVGGFLNLYVPSAITNKSRGSFFLHSILS
jgi:hypothetical protein